MFGLLDCRYQTGRLRIQVNQFRPNPRPQQGEGGNNVEARQNPGENNNPEAQRPLRPHGLIGELSALVIPFFYSLLPTYQPVQHP